MIHPFPASAEEPGGRGAGSRPPEPAEFSDAMTLRAPSQPDPRPGPPRRAWPVTADALVEPLPAERPPAGGPPVPTGPTQPGGQISAGSRTSARRNVQAALVLLLMAQVAAGYRGFFAGAGFLLPLGGSVLVSGAVAVAAAARLRKIDAVVLAAAGGWLLYAPLALFGSRGADLPAAFVDALHAGWADLLTVGLPADPTAELLVIPSLLLWVATFAAVTLALRTETALLPLLPAVLAVLLTLVLTAAGGHSQLLLTGCFTGTALLLVLLRTSHTAGSAAAAGSLALGLPLVAGAAAVATLGASVLPLTDDTARFDPREHRQPPVDTSALLDPLAQVQVELRTDPPRSLFTAHVSSSTGQLPVDRLRIAALGDFDGAGWRDDGGFVRAGNTLPQDGPAVTAATTELGLDVTLDDWDDPLLPAAGVPVGLRGLAVSVQAESGAIAAAAIPRTGEGYRLRAEIAAPGAEDLRLARAASGPATDRAAALPPGLDPELVRLADEVMGSAATPYDKLLALERHLRDPVRFPYDANARPGHSYGAVARLLGTSDDPADGTTADGTTAGGTTAGGTAAGAADENRRGYAEQHAAAFAVLARTQGFPTRIAVGYLLDQQGTDGTGAYRVTTRQAHAWPEVALEGIGWVPFEPTDLSRLGLTLPPVDNTTAGDAAQQDQTVDVVTPVLVPQLDPSGAPTGGGGEEGRGWLGYAAAVLALPLPLLLLVPLEKARRRRRRRRAGTPATRIAAAWREISDRLSEHGLPAAATLTPREVAGRARDLPGCAAAAPQLGMLAPPVTKALFAAAEPGEDDARRIWELTGLASRSLGHRPGARWRGYAARARAAVDPRPLLPTARQVKR
ncbi:protein of unknown function (DUF4129) [Frankia sp. EI5c]|uniref:transglutaminase domain-containing protein n=1 Tax=Frankia sp. EI5c TaxID=683316 RepID=UPI0007C3B641|nr:transglutaminase domain-containing protein [Frankia sp. EI5c]OAA18393.1 protein of unknown function (DUF4129) [Frankia sp. EI5c]